MTRFHRNAAVLAVTLSFAFVTTCQAGVETFEIDRAHSSITFKIRHLLSKVPGQFREFQGKVEIDPEKRDTVNVTATVDTGSIDTDNQKRDEHLRGADFFDAGKFPKMTFQASKLTDVSADHTKAKLEGTLTIRDVTKPVVLDVEWYGIASDPWGNRKAAFAATGKVNRKDFGMIWNKTLDSGNYLLGDEVEIEVNVEAQVPKAQ